MNNRFIGRIAAAGVVCVLLAFALFFSGGGKSPIGDRQSDSRIVLPFSESRGESGTDPESPVIVAETAGRDSGEGAAGTESENVVIEPIVDIGGQSTVQTRAETFTVTEYDSPRTMYTTTKVNIRLGAGVDYEKVSTTATGTRVQVTGETDNGWYQVLVNDELGFMKTEYLQSVRPGTAFVFAGDSRTVQMSYAIRHSEYKWIAKVGEGYNFFSTTAVPEIESSIGEGTRVILNFGVNDLYDADKYVARINDRIDSWLGAGAVVYYAAVTPVGESASITNEEICTFNDTLREGLDERIIWLDGYTYLMENGFSTPDGLHYEYDTYRRLYAFYLTQL